MDLKTFITKAVKDIVEAAEEVSTSAVRQIKLDKHENKRTIEFDIAVSAEESTEGGGKGGIKVLEFFEIGGGASKEVKNSTVSRIQFGVNVDSYTKVEKAHQEAQYRALVDERRDIDYI